MVRDWLYGRSYRIPLVLVIVAMIVLVPYLTLNKYPGLLEVSVATAALVVSVSLFVFAVLVFIYLSRTQRRRNPRS